MSEAAFLVRSFVYALFYFKRRQNYEKTRIDKKGIIKIDVANNGTDNN